MRRRTFTRLAGVSLLGSVRAEASAFHGADVAEAFAAALAAPATGQTSSRPMGINTLSTAVARAKQSYQASRYREVMAQLPRLLADLETASDNLEGDARLKASALSADAYHVAASILLKLDDHGPAWLAADRSMKAAKLSEDPLAVGSSARVITHALMAEGHLGAATATASRFAERIENDVQRASADSLSVYGSLLLRGAIAAGQAEDRAAAMALLDEAAAAASRLGADYNH